MDEKELLRRLRQAFKMESAERLASLSSSLVQLEATEDDDRQQEILEVVYREAHSLKGASRAVNLSEIEAVCQAMESVFKTLKEEEISLSSAVFDTLLEAVHFIEGTLENEQGEIDRNKALLCIKNLGNISKDDKEQETSSPDSAQKVAEIDLVSVFEQAEALDARGNAQSLSDEIKPDDTKEDETSIVDSDVPITRTPFQQNTLRITSDKLDKLLRQAEEMISIKLSSAEEVRKLKSMRHIFARWQKKWAHTNDTLKNLQKGISHKRKTSEEKLAEIEKFLLWNTDFIKSLSRDVNSRTKIAEQNQKVMDRKIDDFLDQLKEVVMLPCSTLLHTFPRMIREICRDQGKQAQLSLKGGDIEIDRRILEEIKDPLIHLIRNSIDHGMEKPRERLRLQKPEKGKITLHIRQFEGGKVEIIVADDGQGIDPDKIRESAVAKGLYSGNEADELTDHQIQSLIFQSGLTTSPIITHLSGRGLGMAIVRERIEKLGGKLDFSSTPGKGTTISIKLPVALSTFRGTLIRCSGELFVAPSSQVESVLQVGREEIRSVEGKTTLSYAGRPLSLVGLANVLGVSGTTNPEKHKKIQVIVLSSAYKIIGFQVDAVLAEQEVLVKDLGKQLKRVKNIAAATILRGGKVVPILHVNDLIRSAEKDASTSLFQSHALHEEKEERKKSILVVEDSITSRTLLKNILETSGYKVTTAVDGLAGYNLLKTGEIDLVVSDIEMPRMNGFELTEKIRADASLSHLPLILCSTLASQEDRERGINVGANAYIVKGDFDQSNLLGVIGRLI